MHRYGNSGNMYRTVQIICFTKVFYVTAVGFVGSILFSYINSNFSRVRKELEESEGPHTSARSIKTPFDHFVGLISLF